MILKKGVTGFSDVEFFFELDEVAENARITQFKRNCYVFANQLKGEVLKWFDPDIVTHYARAHMKIDGKELYIFLNNMYDYIAFSNNGLITELEFIDHPLLKSMFETSYNVLTVAQLTEPLVRRHLKGRGTILLNDNELFDTELKYMDYFSSQTVGDLIFNYWD